LLKKSCESSKDLTSHEYQSKDKTNALIFKDILESIDYLINIVNPEEVVICIDGVAPVSKQIQQRQRRFLTKVINNVFDSNCISPGTKFLYELGLYLKLSIERKMESEWLNIKTVHFMDSLVPGEGEHKLFDFLRSNQSIIVEKKFNIVVHGNDADLILLSLIASINLNKNVLYVLREDVVSKKYNYNLICLNTVKNCILSIAESKPGFQIQLCDYIIYDFLILSFLVGNDFIPSVPLFNIYDGGLDILMKYYFSQSTYISFKEKNKLKINFKILKDYFHHILYIINPNAIEHYKMRDNIYPNNLLDLTIQKLERSTNPNEVTIHYLKAYSLHHKITSKMVQSYLKELEWVLHYYVYGSTSVDWKIYFPSQYAPTSIDLKNYLNSNPNCIFTYNNKCTYIDPFFQLLCILPPHSSNLLPYPFNEILCKDLKCFHPLKIKIDYDGKLNEWEGIPILPPLNYDKIFKIYKNNIHLCSKNHLKRNKKSNQLMITVG
jgi:5'-3' exonuclease